MSGWRREASYHCLSRRRRKLEPSVSNRRLFFDARALRAEDPSPAAGSWQIKKSMSTSCYSFDK
jgi:hypothetical protein